MANLRMAWIASDAVGFTDSPSLGRIVAITVEVPHAIKHPRKRGSGKLLGHFKPKQLKLALMRFHLRLMN